MHGVGGQEESPVGPSTSFSRSILDRRDEKVNTPCETVTVTLSSLAARRSLLSPALLSPCPHMHCTGATRGLRRLCEKEGHHRQRHHAPWAAEEVSGSLGRREG